MKKTVYLVWKFTGWPEYRVFLSTFFEDYYDSEVWVNNPDNARHFSNYKEARKVAERLRHIQPPTPCIITVMQL